MIICARCEALVPEPGECPSCKRGIGAAFARDVEPPPLRAGALLRGYRVQALISRHRRRNVYRASDARGRPCILKELCLDGATEKRRADLTLQHERESSALGRVSVPGVPRLLASFAGGDRRYLAIERLPGRSLWELRDSGPVPETRALEIVAGVAAILKGIHGARPPIFHLDLSPGNVLVTSREAQGGAAVSLIDFGNARSPGEAPIRLFTEGFDSPERHFAPDVEGAGGDIYALGAILHYLASGHDPGRFPPFLLPPLGQLTSRVSARTEALCLWLLQPLAHDRPADAATALEATLGRHPIPDAGELRRAIERFEPESLRLLARHAGARRSSSDALALARSLLGRGHSAAARRVLLDAYGTLRVEPPHRRGPDAGGVATALAELYLLGGDATRALAVCDEAPGIARRESRATLLAARALAALEGPAAALRRLEVAAPEAPGAGAAELLAEKASLLLAAGRPREAESAARAALDFDRRAFAAARTLDRAAVDPRRVPELEARLAAAPFDVAARADLGLALLARGEKERGAVLLEEADAALELGHPVEPWSERRLRRWRLRRLAEEGRALEPALALADAATSRFPRSPFFVFYGGVLAFLLERHEAAAERFERLAALGDDAEPDGESDEHLAGARAWCWRGRSLEPLGRVAEARACYERAVAAAPAFDEAVRHLRRLTLAPESAAA